MRKKALITGITGQDGSYLAEFLLDKGYDVHGVVRRVALENQDVRLGRINHIKNKITLHPGDIGSYSRLSEIFDKIQPDECYHLAAQSFVHESFEDIPSTLMTNVEGTANTLLALKNKSPKCKFYFAGSSEMFGQAEETPQTEETKFHPRSPYGISKVTGFHIARNFREAYNTFTCSGILFNHESPRRGLEFVTRKITSSVARMQKGLENVLVMGNLDAKRDWGCAGDYVGAMWLMLQQENPDDYVIATGESHSIKEFLDAAFDYAKLKYENVDLHKLTSEEADREVEKLGKDKKFVVQHPRFHRPAEVNDLLGNANKALLNLGWAPEVSFEKLVRMMVQHDVNS